MTARILSRLLEQLYVIHVSKFILVIIVSFETVSAINVTRVTETVSSNNVVVVISVHVIVTV
jgi:hypothetical protein